MDDFLGERGGGGKRQKGTEVNFSASAKGKGRKKGNWGKRDGDAKREKGGKFTDYFFLPKKGGGGRQGRRGTFIRVKKGEGGGGGERMGQST